MGLLKNSLSALGRLLTVVALAATFLVGLVGVVYLQLSGEEITIPKVVGKNFNVGKDELTSNGLKIKKIASRYSNEEPNTILEQRPRAGTVAKTGLMISVIVSEPNPDGYEEPVKVKDDEEAIDEIESLPELKTDKSKKKSSKSKKPEKKNRDVIKKDNDKEDSKDDKKEGATDDSKKDSADKTKTDTKTDNKADSKKNTTTPPKTNKPPKPKGVVEPKPKKDSKKPAKTGNNKPKPSN